MGAADPRNVAPLNAFYLPAGEGALDGGDVFFSPVFATMTTFLIDGARERSIVLARQQLGRALDSLWAKEVAVIHVVGEASVHETHCAVLHRLGIVHGRV